MVLNTMATVNYVSQQKLNFCKRYTDQTRKKNKNITHSQSPISIDKCMLHGNSIKKTKKHLSYRLHHRTPSVAFRASVQNMSKVWQSFCVIVVRNHVFRWCRVEHFLNDEATEMGRHRHSLMRFSAYLKVALVVDEVKTWSLHILAAMSFVVLQGESPKMSPIIFSWISSRA